MLSAKTTLSVGAIVALLIVAAAIVPWVFLWTVGVLFGVYVPFTFKTWLACLLFLMAVRGGKS